MKVYDGMYLNTKELAAVTQVKEEKRIKSTRELTSQVRTSESMRGVKQYAAVATGYVNIPEDGVYFISSDLEEVWIDGKLLVNNGGEVKRFSRHDSSVALAKGLHEIKAVFFGAHHRWLALELERRQLKLRKGRCREIHRHYT